MKLPQEAAQKDLGYYFSTTAKVLKQHGTFERDTEDLMHDTRANDPKIQFYQGVPISFGVAYKLACTGEQIVRYEPEAAASLAIKPEYNIEFIYRSPSYSPLPLDPDSSTTDGFYVGYDYTQPDLTTLDLKLPMLKTIISDIYSEYYSVTHAAQQGVYETYFGSAEPYFCDYTVKGQPKTTQEMFGAPAIHVVTPEKCAALLAITQHLPSIGEELRSHTKTGQII